MENLDAVQPGAAAQSLVGSVDYNMSFMDRHTSAVSNNTISMDTSMKPLFTPVNCFPMPPPTHT
jgi:hypothetical protein